MHEFQTYKTNASYNNNQQLHVCKTYNTLAVLCHSDDNKLHIQRMRVPQQAVTYFPIHVFIFWLMSDRPSVSQIS
jgi:hypothetical protein